MIWENIIETYIIICETDCQSRFDAWDRVLRAGALGWPRGMRWGGRWEWGSGWGTHVHPWLIHVNVWQKPLQYCKVISCQLNKFLKKLKNKGKFQWCPGRRPGANNHLKTSHGVLWSVSAWWFYAQFIFYSKVGLLPPLKGQTLEFLSKQEQFSPS